MNTTSQVRASLDRLGNEYDALIENRNKLNQDCEKLRTCIDQQITQIQSLNQDFERLRLDYVQKKEELSTKSNPESPKPAATANPPGASEQAERLWEVQRIVPDESIKNPIQVTLTAEIMDVSVICSTSFSPDGRYLAIGSDRTLRVYNIEKGQFLIEYPISDNEDGSSNHIRSLAWTPDGKEIICGGEDHHIRIIELPNGNLASSFEAGNGEIFQIQCGESFFVSACGDGAVSIWSLKDLSKIASMVKKYHPAEGKSDADKSDESLIATSLSLSEDESCVAVGYTDHTVAVWSIATHELLFEQSCHSDGVYAVKFLPGMKRLATSSLDSTVKIWDYDANKKALTLWKNLSGHTNYVLTLAVDPKGVWLISGSKDLSVKISSLESGEMIYSIKAHTNSVISVSFSPSGGMFCSGSGDQSVLIWSMAHEQNEEA